MKSIKAGDVLFHKYKILRKLGEGASAEVFLCHNLKLRSKCAVKVINKQRCSFRNEEGMLSKLNSLNIPGIIDVMEDDKYTYIVETFVEGTPLDKLMLTHGCFRENKVIVWAMQLCDTLEYLHGIKPNAIIYRDIKPSNIMITPDNKAVLIDFGACREYDGIYNIDEVIAGTSIYSAPEQLILDGITDQRTDIYGVGAVMYKLLTGENPNDILREKFAAENTLSRGIRNIVLKCIEIERIRRYNSINELKNSLENQYKLNIMKDMREDKLMKLLPQVIAVLSIINYLVAFIGLKI
ncbi:MAG: serine/threonine protein kinase [Bacillota bacterium]